MLILRALSLLVAVGLLHPDMAHADDLRVDFGAGGVQSAYAPFHPVDGVTQVLPSPLGIAGVVVVSLATPGLDWRVRSGITSGPFVGSSDLLSDFVSTESSSLTVWLVNLAAGHYSLTTYHHDTLTGNHGAINVFVEDATGTALVGQNVVQSWGTSPASIAAVAFEAVADCAPVRIRLDRLPFGLPRLPGCRASRRSGRVRR
jgi:hypothetical protein